MRRATHRGRGLALLVGFEAAGLWILTRLGARPDLHIPWDDMAMWLATAPAEVAVAAAVHKLAFVGAAWLAFSTVGYLVAASMRAPRAMALFRAVTLPFVRSAVDRAVALSLAAALAMPPSLVVPDDPGGPAPPAAPTSVLPPGSAAVGYAPSPPGRERVEAGNSSPPRDLAPSAPPRQARTHVVEPGDNLWRIAAADIARHGGSTADVATHWVRIVEVNRTRIRSADPDLIYPGERILLPDIGEDDR